MKIVTIISSYATAEKYRILLSSLMEKSLNATVRKIQNVAFFINGKVAQLALDSGCEGDCIPEDECYRLNLQIMPLDSTETDTHIPTQADGMPPLNVIGR